ncbi:MAG: hypothetical protein KBD66_03480 [Candidatus Doudnabacteria bacterium]|nr:hypothetical protein [Candidatus Doudnabacteria bacterium]
MTERELHELLEEIKSNTAQAAKGLPWWKVLVNGVFGGFGYVVGFIFAVTVLGFVLNVIGVIPAFRREVEDWQKLLQQTQQQKLPSLKSNTQSGE